jgi:phage tail-like protein
MSTTSSGTTFYPPVKFKFSVTFTGGGISGEAGFTEVSGISQEMNEEVIPEGGVLTLVHSVPTGLAQGTLTLKRGLLTSSSVRTWIQNAMVNFQFTPIQVQVNLLDSNNSPIMTWTFENVWPKRWEIDPLNSTENNYVVESMTLAFSAMSGS